MLAHFSNQNSSGEGRQATSQVEAQMLMRYMVQLELETNGFQCSVVAKLTTTSYPRSVLSHTTQRIVCPRSARCTCRGACCYFQVPAPPFQSPDPSPLFIGQGQIPDLDSPKCTRSFELKTTTSTPRTHCCTHL